MPKTFKRRPRRQALLALGGLLTAGEAMVGSGIQLPFADQIPWWLRLAVIGLVMGGAWLVREQVDAECGHE